MTDEPDADEPDTDEYIVTYKHYNKRLNTIHWQGKEDGENRRNAIKHAADAARSRDVTQVKVGRRTPTPWESVEWRTGDEGEG